MITPKKMPLYIPLNQSGKLLQAKRDYLKSVDQKYGTQFTIQNVNKPKKGDN
jgi:hypothetical protein